MGASCRTLGESTSAVLAGAEWNIALTTLNSLVIRDINPFALVTSSVDSSCSIPRSNVTTRGPCEQAFVESINIGVGVSH